MTCAGCGRANREGATFCAGCGATGRIIEVTLATRRDGVVKLKAIGSTAGGAGFESDSWFVVALIGDLVSRLGQFPLDQRAEVEACFARLERPS
jgi:hypothetical protein